MIAERAEKALRIAMWPNPTAETARTTCPSITAQTSDERTPETSPTALESLQLPPRELLDLLTFDHLTDIALAVVKRQASAELELSHLEVGDLGPFVEMWLRLQPWKLKLAQIPTMAESQLGFGLKQSQLHAAPSLHDHAGATVGFLRLSSTSGQLPDIAFTQLGVRAKRAAVESGLPDLAAASLVGAMKELRDNVVEHSRRPHSGLIAFRATDDRFEFCVADAGKGVLASLRENPKYSGLADSGQALRVALTDGESRFGPGLDRGYGFHDLFRALQKIQGVVHFKSGDHSLEYNGLSPTVGELDLAQCADLTGFLVSVTCLTPGANSLRHGQESTR